MAAKAATHDSYPLFNSAGIAIHWIQGFLFL